MRFWRGAGHRSAETVFDPEIPVNIVDLGLVYGSAITPLQGADKRIDVKMTRIAHREATRLAKA